MRPIPAFFKFSTSSADRLIRALAAVIVVISMTIVWIDAQKNHYVPCVENCGENFLVFKYVKDFRLYGFKYGLLEDYATSPDPERKPYLYTHNANLPGMSFALMDAIGLHELWQKQFVILLIHGLGLAFVFIATAHLSGSSALGIVTLLLFCLDYNLVFNFAMNPLRAWHWLALFGLTYFSVRLAETLGQHKKPIAGLVVFAGLAFGLGYDFFAICSTVALLAVFLWLPRPLLNWKTARVLILFFLLLAVPVALRQIQVMAVLGPDFWLHDIGYSLQAKIPALRNFFFPDSEEVIAQYYLSKGVVRFSPPDASALATLWPHLKDLIRFIVLPIIGLLTILATIAVCTVASLYLTGRSFAQAQVYFDRWLKGNEAVIAFGTSRLVLVFAAGCVLGIAIFPFHNVQIYVKHLVPLIAAPIFICKAALIVFLIHLWRRTPRRKIQIVSMVILLGFIVDHARVELDYMRSKSPYDMGWISEVKARADSVFAISWMPTAVSVFTNRDAVSLSAQQQSALLERVKTGHPPFEKNSDFTPAIVLPGDAQDNLLQPDYWLYFPIESPFDSPEPDCQRDYLSASIYQFLEKRKKKSVTLTDGWTLPQGGSVRPGDYVVFGGQIQGLGEKVPKLKLRGNQEFEHQIAFNCHTNTYKGWIRTPVGNPMDITLTVEMVFPRAENLASFKIKTSMTAPKSSFSLPSDVVAWPKPSAQALASSYQEIPIAAKGADWILFDLKTLYAK